MPASALKIALTRRIVSGPGLLAPLRASRYGLDWLLRRRPELELYYQVGDPHSHLCAAWLRANSGRIGLPLAIRLVAAPEPLLYPEAERQRRFALDDARMIAPAYGLAFAADAQLPERAACDMVSAQLARCSSWHSFLEAEAALVPALFQAQAAIPQGPALAPAVLQRRLQQNAQRRARLGHYLPAMWQLQGRWYWALDRLHHLQAHLQTLGALAGTAPLDYKNPQAAQLPKPPAGTPLLEFFYSFRSPYSYLAAEQLPQLLSEHDLRLQIRPVLPMAMRGHKVPARKRLYIARDAKREADQLGIDFGDIVDPLGDGARRCLSAFALLTDSPQQLAFIRSAGRGIWAEAIDVASDDGLRQVCERAGMNWSAVRRTLANEPDLSLAEANRQALFEAGFWGVPTYRVGELKTWGRDRAWLVSEYLRRAKAP